MVVFNRYYFSRAISVCVCVSLIDSVSYFLLVDAHCDLTENPVL